MLLELVTTVDPDGGRLMSLKKLADEGAGSRGIRGDICRALRGTLCGGILVGDRGSACGGLCCRNRSRGRASDERAYVRGQRKLWGVFGRDATIRRHRSVNVECDRRNDCGQRWTPHPSGNTGPLRETACAS